MSVLTDDNLQQIRSIVREETDDMRQDISVLKTNVTRLQTDVSKMQSEITRTFVLMQTQSEELKVVTELLSTNLDVKSHVINHDKRLTNLEIDNKHTKRTLTIHSRQLKTLT